MAWMTPKTDWNPEDYVNASDINRIENNTRELRDYLISIQYVIPSLTFIDNRTNASIDFLSSINRIEKNIETIRRHFATPLEYGGTQIWDVGRGFTNIDMNRLEGNIGALYELGHLAFENFRYSGTFYSGEEGVFY